MAKKMYKGIPRNKIPWYPIIDKEKCTNCGKCVEYCSLGTFGFEEKDGEKQVVIKNPYNCVVLCTGCDSICPTGAMSHPSVEETEKIIEDLQKNV
ncbi:MAG: 4Fe-4S dicluster domain-containing protein [Candidatus Bathyarchaeota archaeon]|nr:ferredoxin family protein [Candidatus Bathyarchaeum tardum]WGM89804.1 MAG: ferredoxin family protein [Candidatus Bathyarchaeum tardum]WNZ30098.1 MAG: 4Fe-4S dicluster domain-containing protein [Candidatus Bathyarchaeota archaeon]